MKEQCTHPEVTKYRFDRAYCWLGSCAEAMVDLCDTFESVRLEQRRRMGAAPASGKRLGHLLHEAATSLAQIGADTDARTLRLLEHSVRQGQAGEPEACMAQVDALMTAAGAALQQWLRTQGMVRA